MMEQFSKNAAGNKKADALLQKLKDDLVKNADDRQAMEEAASLHQKRVKRYQFRTMKKEEYLAKKRIADKIASAADSTEISDDELEALLRSYFKDAAQTTADASDTDAAEPPVPDVQTSAPEEASAVIPDADMPLTKEEPPFFEEVPLQMEDAAESEKDLFSDPELSALFSEDVVSAPQPQKDMDVEPATEDLISVPDDEKEQPEQKAQEDPKPAKAAKADADLDLDFAALLDALPSDALEEVEDSDIDALLQQIVPAEKPARAETIPTVTVEDLTEPSLSAADSNEEAPDPLAELLSMEDIPAAEKDEKTAETKEPETEAISDAAEATEAPADEDFLSDISDEDLADLLGMADESEAADVSQMTPDVTDTTDTEEAPAADPFFAAEAAQADAPETDETEETDETDEALLDALTSAEEDTETAMEDPASAETAEEDEEEPLLAEELDRAIGTGGDDISDVLSDDFDQTDLDLMIAFGMEDQLEKRVGKEEAKKYRKAMGARKDDHIHEMHKSDRPDFLANQRSEYVSGAQNKEIFSEYKKKYSSVLFRILGAFLLLILMFLFENDQLVGLKLPSLFDRETYPLVYVLFDLQLVLLCCALVTNSIRNGIRAMFHGKPIPESIMGFLFLASLTYTIIIASLCPMRGLQMYNFPIALAVFFELFYEFMNLRREIMSFKIVSSKRLKYAVDAIPNAEGEAEKKLFADYISDDPVMFRIKRSAFVEGFFQRTDTYPKTQRILRMVLPAVLILCLAFFAAEFMLTGEVYTALNVSYITLLLTLPSYAFISFSYPMYRASGFAYEKDSAMIGEASLSEYADASVVSFDDKEVFPARGIRVRNVKVYGDNRIDHVIYAASSVFHLVGGPLADVFETAAGELGYAENVTLTRLDPDGIETQVDGGAVLVGKASFINRYGYSVSLNESEQAMEQTGDACVMYIAYDNSIAAKLYIQYSVEPDFEVVLKQLYHQGVCVGIKTSDPNIDDRLLACKIKMSKYPVKIIKCAEPKETAIIVDRLNSGIVSKSSAKALLQTLAMCDRVLSASRTNNIIKFIAMVLAMAAMVFFVVAGVPVTAAPLWIAVYQLFWIIPTVIISRFYI